MTTTPSPSQRARLITPEDQPVFPCWLYERSYRNIGWVRFSKSAPVQYLPEFTHWHPDSPTAPTCVPQATQPTPPREGLPNVTAILCHLFAMGYQSGHEDTVEARFTDVHQSDKDTYFADDDCVQEALAALAPYVTAPSSPAPTSEETIQRFARAMENQQDTPPAVGAAISKNLMSLVSDAAPTSGKVGTPMTEEAITSFNDQCDVPVSASFARRLERDLTSAREELGKLGADYRELRDDSADIAKDNITLREEVERLKEANASFAVTVKTYEALTTSLRATSEAMAGALEAVLEYAKSDMDEENNSLAFKAEVASWRAALARYRAATPVNNFGTHNSNEGDASASIKVEAKASSQERVTGAAALGFDSPRPTNSTPAPVPADEADGEESKELSRIELGAIAWKAFVASMQQTTDGESWPDKPPHEEEIAMNDAAVAVATAIRAARAQGGNGT